MPPRSLDAYYEKRQSGATPEPFGLTDSLYYSGAFVVQQHGARSLHWDLRLAIDGVLVSWAVPKGPSSDPNEKRLAVQTEDHPLDYCDFEGVIPSGNYGAGPMILWDRGSYRNYDGVPASEGLARGKLDLELYGHKLRGRWALVRIKKGETGREWLLCKKADAFASSADVVTEAPYSVVSGLDLGQRVDPSPVESKLRSLAAAAGGRPETESIAKLRPMLAGQRQHPFSDPDWVYEVKYDGYRAIVGRDEAGDRFLHSRRGHDFRHRFPEIHLVSKHLPADSFAIDGEIIAADDSGAGSFERLQQRATGAPQAAAITLVMYAFDLLHLSGFDLRHLPLIERKRLLRELLPPLGPVRYADHIEGAGEKFYEAARERNLEGIIAKRADSIYLSGRRVDSWLKIKIPRLGELVVVGWQSGRDGRALGSLLLGWHVSGELRYAGSAGSGIDESTAEALLARLRPADAPRFSAGDLELPKRASFAEPELVARIRYTEVTSRGALRQPVFEGLVEDRDWRACGAPSSLEESDPPAAEDGEAAASATNLDKIFWPRDGYTKGDLLAYYEAVWPFIGPYLRGRPLVMTRYPDGIDGKSFFQRNAPEFIPEWLTTARVEDNDLLVCNDLRSLLYVANLGSIPLHLWSSRQPDLSHPTWTILDLDPKGADFTAVVEVARHIHRLLDSIGVPNFVKTSGQSGLHVLLPLAGDLTHDQAKMFAEVIARAVAQRHPDLATVARPLRQRGDRVYIDFLQNGFGKTIAAPLCARPIDGAPVSMPLRWSQVTARLRPQRFTIRTAVQRLRRDGDPLAPVLDAGLDAAAVDAALVALAPLLEQ